MNPLPTTAIGDGYSFREERAVNRTTCATCNATKRLIVVLLSLPVTRVKAFIPVGYEYYEYIESLMNARGRENRLFAC